MKETFRYFVWVVAATFWTTICFIAPDFIDNPHEGLYGTLIIIAYISLCGLCSFFLLYLIGCNKIINAFILPIWAILGAALSFYRIGYHATLTPMLIDVTLHTNTEEALGVISLPMVAWIIFNLLISLIFIRSRIRLELSHPWIHGIIISVIGCTIFFSSDRLQSSLCQRFPYNIPYNIHTYVSLQRDISQERRIPNYDIINEPDSLTIILILGEAARADHLQLNGYERETNPRLTNRENIISFPNIYSEQTHTLASLPYILTRADSIHDEYQYTETSFVSIFRKAGFYTSWISNQDLGSTFSHYLSECDSVAFANAGKSVYVYSQWLDEDMIPILQSNLSTHSPRTVSIMHSIGSHWYYNTHVPQSGYYFLPITVNRVVSSNTIEEIVNSYDNTILYMDFFVDAIITLLENSNSIVIYQSDHGEALGEDNLFLHANDAEAVKHPACVVWFSDKYKKANPEKVEALIRNKDKRYRTDYVFYSILYAAGIEAEGDCPEMNIFR